jgi:hypothetical protein
MTLDKSLAFIASRGLLAFVPVHLEPVTFAPVTLVPVRLEPVHLERR